MFLTKILFLLYGLFILLVSVIQKYTNIHEAVKAGDVNELAKMVKCGANVNEIRGRDKFTPLHTACNIGTLEVRCSYFLKLYNNLSTLLLNIVYKGALGYKWETM